MKTPSLNAAKEILKVKTTFKMDSEIISEIAAIISRHYKSRDKAFRELAEAGYEMERLAKEYNRLLRRYPAGTCNAEDAWRDYGIETEKAEKRFSKTVKNAKKLI